MTMRPKHGDHEPDVNRPAVAAITPRKRKPPTIETQLEIYFRDRWMCHLCHRPTIFNLTFKLLQRFVREAHPQWPLAMWGVTLRRDQAPLLDELAAMIDHDVPFKHGGTDDRSNYKTACARCNARKGSTPTDKYLGQNPPWTVKGKYGEPLHWDGLTRLFVVLARKPGTALTARERAWLKVLEHHFADGGDS